jgi:hypothetical protein
MPSVRRSEPSVRRSEPSVRRSEPSVRRSEPSVRRSEPSVRRSELLHPLLSEGEGGELVSRVRYPSLRNSSNSL